MSALQDPGWGCSSTGWEYWCGSLGTGCHAEGRRQERCPALAFCCPRTSLVSSPPLRTLPAESLTLFFCVACPSFAQIKSKYG